MSNQFQISNDKTGKVLVAMSGGVDSSVAAALLAKQGYDVTGGFIKCFTDPLTGPACWLNEKRDALRVCAKLGIKLVIFDFEKEYRKAVVKYLYRQYGAGRTPNPDVMCNKHVKFPLLIREAKKLGFDYIATGHYARLERYKIQDTRYKLMRAVDANKDQTYFLHQLTQKELKHVMFPIGGYSKPQVRELAKKFGLSVAQKEESMGICFVGEVPLRQFLSKKIKPRKGKIVLPNGTVVGEHAGLPFYTIGQRIGIQVKSQKSKLHKDTKPFYVVAKDKKKNLLIVGHEDDPFLYKKEIIVQKINWIAGRPPKLPFHCLVRLRHRQPLQRCVLCHSERSREATKSKNLIVKFLKPQRAVAPGQFAVFYKGKECLGGGEIA